MSSFARLKNWRVWRLEQQYDKASVSTESYELADGFSNETTQDVDATMTDRNPHHGWRRVVILATIITTVVLLVNLIFAITAFFTFDASRGVGNIFKGNCLVIKNWNTALHLLINLLSTIVLAASNFTMQCLTSPTRRDVDIAHSRGVSLDIGVPSIKNLFHVRHWKRVVWLSLCVSTLPLHLLWNSAIFPTIVYNQFDGVVVDQQFMSTESSQYPHYGQCLESNSNGSHLPAFIYNGYVAGNYTNMSSQSCVKHFSELYIESAAPALYHRNLVFVFNTSLAFTKGQCNDTGGEISIARANYPHCQEESNGTSGCAPRSNLAYCYRETKGLPECTLHYSSYLFYIVGACNAIKVICMFITARMLWNDGGFILATVGDATASFLEIPDERTKQRCVADNAYDALDTCAPSITFSTTYERRSRANMVDRMRLRWAISSVSCVAVMIIGVTLIILSNNMSSTMNIPHLSAPDGIEFVWMIIAANSPQLILSMTYFCCNSFISAQCAVQEWAAFARSKKPLRVTWPRGQQRSTYWLSLPYRYSVPFIALLLLIHFVLSQSVFIGRSQTFDSTGANTGQGINGVISAIYFSQKYSLATLALGFVLIVHQFMATRRGFDNRVPCHGNNSALISGMCHLNDPYRLGKEYSKAKLREAAAGSLMWGVTREAIESDRTNGSKDIPGHCSFSPDVIGLPVRGKRYE